MIPKIIHYVWVGNNPKSDLTRKCIQSWKKYCPDYEIIEWGNDILNKLDNRYVQEAYQHKKWAFVSDYIRLYVLYHHGGFYCDTDLEITSPLESFRHYAFVASQENWQSSISPISTALIGAEKNNYIIANLLNLYADIPFIKKGNPDQTTNVTRFTKYIRKNYPDLIFDGHSTIRLTENAVIYPSYYFSTPETGKNNYAIHHFDGSWIEPYARKIIFSFGKYKVVRFKRRPEISIEGMSELPLLSDEKKLYELAVSNTKKICILKDINRL